MQDFYVHGDVHNFVDAAQAWLNVVQPNRVIWLGDFWDFWGDTPKDAKHTAMFVSKLMFERSNDIFLLSNHDVTYKLPLHYASSKWGFTPEKCRAIHSVFPREYWKKFQVFHREFYRGQEVLFSHAGLTSRVCPNGQYDYEFLKRQEKIALNHPDTEESIPMFDGLHGPLWKRWQLPLLDGVCQVVGHTPCECPQILKVRGRAEWNVNLDCAKTWVAHFTENGIYYVHKSTGERRPAKFLNSDTRI